MAGAYDDEVAATAAYRQADFATALRLIRPLADQGDALAEVDLAGLYSDGHGVAKDAAAATGWYRKAAEQDFAPAEYFLAHAVEPRAPLVPAGSEASRLLHRAAEQGFAPAEFELGMFSVLAMLTPDKPMPEADKWLQKASDAGYAPAEALLGMKHAIHVGLPQEQAEALRLLRLGADQGDMTAEEGLGALYAREHGVPPDFQESFRWYLKAAEQGDATAQRQLSTIYAKGLGVVKDPIQSRMWFEIAQLQIAGKDAARERALMASLYDINASKLSAADIAEAKREAAEWSAQHPPKPKIPEETWLAPTSVAAAGAAALAQKPDAAPAAKACTHEEQVQARLAKQNGYTGGPNCD